MSEEEFYTHSEDNQIYSNNDNKINYTNENLYSDKYTKYEYNKNETGKVDLRHGKKLNFVVMGTAASVVGTAIIVVCAILLSIKVNIININVSYNDLSFEIGLENINDNSGNKYECILSNDEYEERISLQNTDIQTVSFSNLSSYTYYYLRVYENSDHLVFEGRYQTKSYLSLSNDEYANYLKVDYGENVFLEITDTYNNMVPYGDSNDFNVFIINKDISFDDKYNISMYCEVASGEEVNLVLLEKRDFILGLYNERPVINCNYQVKNDYFDTYIDSITISTLSGQLNPNFNNNLNVELRNSSGEVEVFLGEAFLNDDTFTSSSPIMLEVKEYKVCVVNNDYGYVISECTLSSPYKRYLVSFISQDTATVNTDVSDSLVLEVYNELNTKIPVSKDNSGNYVLLSDMMYYGNYHIILKDADNTILEERDLTFNTQKLSFTIEKTALDNGFMYNLVPDGELIPSLNGLLYLVKLIDENNDIIEDKLIGSLQDASFVLDIELTGKVTMILYVNYSNESFDLIKTEVVY